MVSETSGYKVGDVVQLKSGGPRMVVANLQPPLGSQAALAWVNWIDTAGAMQQSIVSVLLLDRLTKDDPSASRPRPLPVPRPTSRPLARNIPPAPAGTPFP